MGLHGYTLMNLASALEFIKELNYESVTGYTKESFEQHYNECNKNV